MIQYLLAVLGLAITSVVSSPVERRQDVVTTSAPATTSSTDGAGGQPVPMAAVIAISVVLGNGVIILILVCPPPVHRVTSDQQIQIRQYRRRSQIAGHPQNTTMQSLTAEDLAGGRRNRAATAQAGTVTRGRRSRRRGVRRTESGRSVKTLPEYSKEAGDEELVLVRYVSSRED